MEYIYEYGRYAVILCEHITEHSNAINGYGVVNTQTDVVEVTTSLLFQAIKWCRTCEVQVRHFEQEQREPTQEELWPQLKDI